MKHDPKDPEGEYFREHYPLSDGDDVFCAKESIVVDNLRQNNTRTITDQVIDIIHQRESKGMERYGHPIDPFDGREWIDEAIEECADQLQYLVAFREQIKGG